MLVSQHLFGVTTLQQTPAHEGAQDASAQGGLYLGRPGAVGLQALRNNAQENAQHHVERYPVALHEIAQSLWDPVVFFDALRVKIRENGVVRNKAVYLALGVLADGTRDILGSWIENTEGAKFWMKVFNDMKTRGCNDVLIAVTDGLKCMGEALEVVYPQTTLQTCIVHLIRNSLDYASWKHRKPLEAAIKPIYTAPSAEAALAELDAFENGPWGKKFPNMVASWRRVWDKVIPFFAFPLEVRRLIYTTNAIESVNARLRKILKTRGHFPNDEAATKLIWLALRNITKDWARAAPHWKAAMNQFAILYQERFTQEANLS